MANVIFAQQRDLNGNAVFANQVHPDTVAIGAILTSSASVLADLSLIKVSLRAGLQSTTSLSSEMKFFEIKVAAGLSATSTMSGTLVLAQSTFRTTLNSRGAVSAQLALVKSTMSATLGSTASVRARTGEVKNPNNILSTTFKVVSTAWAKLYTTLDSKIPDGAIVEAVPSEAEHKHIIRYRGDTYADSFFVFNDRTGDMIDLAGCVLRMTLATKRVPKNAEDIVYTLNGAVDPFEIGKVYFTPTESQADRVGFYWYEIELREPNGTVRTVLSAKYVYKQDITQ